MFPHQLLKYDGPARHPTAYMDKRFSESRIQTEMLYAETARAANCFLYFDDAGTLIGFHYSASSGPQL